MEPSNPDISILRQCELLGLPRSSYYYQPRGESPLNLKLMRLLDEQYTRTPFYGSPKMTLWLKSHLHWHESWISLPDGGHRLVLPICSLLAAFQHAGEFFLRGGFGRGLEGKAAGDLQHRSGDAVYFGGFHWAFERPGDCHQHGWPGTLPG